jgi:hypothetical protein
MKLLSLILVLIIAACAVMFCYLMLYIPHECQNLASRSGGTATCGLNTGAYVIAVTDCIVAAAAAVMLIRGRITDQAT